MYILFDGEENIWLGIVFPTKFGRNLDRKVDLDLLESVISAIRKDFLTRGDERSVVMEPNGRSFVDSCVTGPVVLLLVHSPTGCRGVF